MWTVLNVAIEKRFYGRCCFLRKGRPEIRHPTEADKVKADLWARQRYQL